MTRHEISPDDQRQLAYLRRNATIQYWSIVAILALGGPIFLRDMMPSWVLVLVEIAAFQIAYVVTWRSYNQLMDKITESRTATFLIRELWRTRGKRSDLDD